MNLRTYYQQLRETEAAISEPCVVVVSEETSDGGQAGVRTEVTRLHAARLIVEKRARLATAPEAAEFRGDQQEALRRMEEAAAMERVQLTVLSEADLRALRGSKPVKS